MGITIHYRGRLNDLGQVAKLRAELADIAATMGWEVMPVDDDWEQPADARLRHTSTGAHLDGNLGLKGILLMPDVGTEPLSFLFDREGNLRSMIDMVSILDGTLKPQDACVFVKTQFAPPEVHVWIVGLLKYLQKRYISNLEVSDEGQYWETGDFRILKKKRDFLAEKIDQVSRKLSSPRWADIANLSADEIAARIEQLLLGDDPGRTRSEDPE